MHYFKIHLERLRKTTNFLRITGNSAEIRNGYLSNTSLDVLNNIQERQK